MTGPAFSDASNTAAEALSSAALAWLDGVHEPPGRDSSDLDPVRDEAQRHRP